MALYAVQQNTPQNTRANILNAGLLGGLGGYALKWALPLNRSEQDGDFYDSVKKIETNADIARAKEIEEIKTARPKLRGTDEFVASLGRREESLKLSFDAQTLAARVKNAGDEVRASYYDSLVTNTKRIRPTGIFITIGVISGLFIALAHRLLKSNND